LHEPGERTSADALHIAARADKEECRLPGTEGLPRQLLAGWRFLEQREDIGLCSPDGIRDYPRVLIGCGLSLEKEAEPSIWDLDDPPVEARRSECASGRSTHRARERVATRAR
jgi:hypothetical protein